MTKETREKQELESKAYYSQNHSKCVIAKVFKLHNKTWVYYKTFAINYEHSNSVVISPIGREGIQQVICNSMAEALNKVHKL